LVMAGAYSPKLLQLKVIRKTDFAGGLNCSD
jgi:hypothetical protein